MQFISVIQRDGEPVAACYTVPDAEAIAEAFGIDQDSVFPVPLLKTEMTSEEAFEAMKKGMTR